ncbi:MAG: type II toxin-antitoxin system RelE/ParE family toxin [Lachnospiraceae bacterium]|nr:type II toxin-antitoxin system RelE/ParE family toxin [Lachnospiraceae bacterium]
MIKTFRNKETELIYRQQYSKALPQQLQHIALRKLMMIDNAQELNDLRIPPANHLEALHGDRERQYSIRINEKYRICFEEENGDFYSVEITDYH